MSLDGINGRSIQTLLRGENDSKQSDEFQAIAGLEFFEILCPALRYHLVNGKIHKLHQDFGFMWLVFW